MRKMFKKFCAVSLCIAMAAAALTGCGTKDGEESSTPVSTENTQNTDSGEGTNGEAGDGQDSQETGDGQEGWSGDTSKIYMTYVTMGVEPADLGLIQDAINEISVPEIGVEVEFKPVSVFELASTCTRWIGGGEQLDLMCVAFTGLKPYIDQGMLEPLDELIAAQGPYLQALSERVPLYDPTVAGTVYGCMSIPLPIGQGGAFLISADDLKAADLSYQDGDKVTLDDLDDIFEAVRAVKQDGYICGLFGSLPSAGYNILNDPLGATAASGVLMGLDSTEVVNLYATEEYKNYLEHIRSWYEKGYIMKDAATAEPNLSENCKSGVLSGYYSVGSANLMIQLEQNTGKEYVRLMLLEPFQTAVSAAANSFWTVPVTSKEPEAAVRFMNMMFEDSRLMNLFCWGIEGKHYVVTSEENREIALSEGLSQAEVGYMALGLYGDQNIMYQMGTNPVEENELWTKQAEGRKTKGYGFCYDSSNMTNQIIAVEAVILKREVHLESTYAEFLKKLEANGINDIIADKQAQFDAWQTQQ